MVQFHVLVFMTQIDIPPSPWWIFNLTHNCMGSCHGQILIETATYSYRNIAKASQIFPEPKCRHSCTQTIFPSLPFYFAAETLLEETPISFHRKTKRSLYICSQKNHWTNKDILCSRCCTVKSFSHWTRTFPLPCSTGIFSFIKWLFLRV